MSAVILVPDCGGDAGLGHLERMLALADAMSPGIDLAVAVPERAAHLSARVTARGHRPLPLPGAAPERAAAAAGEATDALVLDGYGFDRALQGSLRRLLPLVLVDDLGGPADCDLAVNPSPGGEGMRPDGADDFLGGAAYALLRADYVDARVRVLRRGHATRTVLVSAGGGDAAGITARLVPLLVRGDADVSVIAVAGPDMDPRPLAVDPRVTVERAPASLAPLLARATVYAGAAGTTAVQAACVGIPAVVTPVADNQRQQAQALARAGCALVTEPAGMADECIHLLDDGPGRDEMARRGRSLVDGRGPSRVAGAVRRVTRARVA